MKNKLPKYKSPVCTNCGQTTHYSLSLDMGSAYIMIAIFNRVRIKRINHVHVAREMVIGKNTFPTLRQMVESGRMTTRMLGNITRCRMHGLIAFAGKKRYGGEFLITPKGARFLRGEVIPRTAIIAKRNQGDDRSNVGYHFPEVDNITITELLEEGVFWGESGNAFLEEIAPRSGQLSVFA